MRIIKPESFCHWCFSQCGHPSLIIITNKKQRHWKQNSEAGSVPSLENEVNNDLPEPSGGKCNCNIMQCLTYCLLHFRDGARGGHACVLAKYTILWGLGL